jgi:hypothetical protein
MITTRNMIFNNGRLTASVVNGAREISNVVLLISLRCQLRGMEVIDVNAEFG